MHEIKRGGNPIRLGDVDFLRMFVEAIPRDTNKSYKMVKRLFLLAVNSIIHASSELISMGLKRDSD